MCAVSTCILFFSRLLWLFRVICGSTQTLGLFFSIFVKNSVGILTEVFCRHDSPCVNRIQDSTKPDSPARYYCSIRVPITSVAASHGEFCCSILPNLNLRAAEYQCWGIVASALNELTRKMESMCPQVPE